MNSENNIVIENNDMKLIIRSNGKSKSLIHKATGEECLDLSQNLSISSLTEYRPYDNELFLTYPAKSRTFQADTAYLSEGILKVGFEDIAHEASILLNIKDRYIGFNLLRFDYKIESIGVKRRTEIDEFVLIQLPIKNRKYFGEWLNVVWDEKVSINLLATDIYAKIDAYNSGEGKILFSGMENVVKLEEVGAALITTSTGELLDCINDVEVDYNLPKGVESRRRKEYLYSYYELRNVNKSNIDEHISYAKLGGFKTIVIYYTDFSSKVGHFEWNKDFENGIEDLKYITNKIKQEGILPGIHIHYNKVHIRDPYVTPKPDSRLNLIRNFTLSSNINLIDSILYVEENPRSSTLEENRRLLKIGNEIISYENYTKSPPYYFYGCKRGALKTVSNSFEKGTKFGLLDVDTWPDFIRVDQNTSLQEEIAERLAKIYNDAGFEFVYFDGAEDVHLPYWHNVSKSQYTVYKKLKPSPIFSEGAIKSHFGWHILSRGNAFDLFKPEDIKKATIKYPMRAARYIAQDFTSINFGWNDYLAPSNVTMGMQPDMYEFICSRAAAWNSPIALMGKLNEIKKHPRTLDNLEVIRNWEYVRVNRVLSYEQKEKLKSEVNEHILIINEKGDYELLEYSEIKDTRTISKYLRAFVFKRGNKSIIVFWHTHDKGIIRLPKLPNLKIRLLERFDKEIYIEADKNHYIIPVDNRKYLELDMNIEDSLNYLSLGKMEEEN